MKSAPTTRKTKAPRATPTVTRDVGPFATVLREVMAAEAETDEERARVFAADETELYIIAPVYAERAAKKQAAGANPNGVAFDALVAVAKVLPEGKREAALREVLVDAKGAVKETRLRAVLNALKTPETKGKATVENRGKTSYKPPVDQSPDIGGAPLDQRQSLFVQLARDIGFAAAGNLLVGAAPPDDRARLVEGMAARGRELTGREAAPKLSAADLAAFMTPQRIAALTADTPLSRLQIRYEKRLQEIVLPEDKIKDVKQARAAGLLGATFRNLVKQQIKAGLKPQPQDERVTKAQRLSVAFYREQKAGHGPPRRRGRPSKFAMNALA